MVFYLHGGLMVLGFLLMIAGILTARYLKKKRWWLRAHKSLGILTVSAIAGGFICGVLMVSASGSAHFGIRHAYVGACVFLMAVATLTMGFLQFRFRARAALLRSLHRWSGRIAGILYLVNIGLGLSLAGFW